MHADFTPNADFVYDQILDAEIDLSQDDHEYFVEIHDLIVDTERDLNSLADIPYSASPITREYEHGRLIMAAELALDEITEIIHDIIETVGLDPDQIAY